MENPTNPNPAQVVNETVVPPAGGGSPAVPSPVTLKDDDLVAVTVDGQVVQKPWKEAREGIMRQEDYTRKTQGVSKKAKELQELYEGLSVREKEILEKEAALDAILGRAPRHTTNENPEEVLTRAQVQDILKAEREAWKAEAEKTVASHVSTVEQNRQVEKWEERTNSIVDNLSKEHPLLADIPHLATILKRDAKQYGATTVEEMFDAIQKAGTALAGKLEKRFEEQQKVAALKKKELAAKGPVRAGGAPAITPKENYIRKNSRAIDWNRLNADVVAALEAADEE